MERRRLPGVKRRGPGALVGHRADLGSFASAKLPTRPQGRAAQIGGRGDAGRRPAGRSEAQGRAAGGCRCSPGTKAWGRRPASTAGDGTRPPNGRRSAASGASCWICGTGWTAGIESPERTRRRTGTPTEKPDGGDARHRPRPPRRRPTAGRPGPAARRRETGRRASPASTGRHRRHRQAGIAGSGRPPAGHYPDSRKRERPRTDYG